MAKPATRRRDGGTQSLPAMRAGARFHVETVRLVSANPISSPGRHPSAVAPFGPGRLPAPVEGSRGQATGPSRRGVSHVAVLALIGTSACTLDAARRHQGGQAQQDGDGRTVTAGGVQVKADHVRWDGDHARHDANAVTRRPFGHSSAVPDRNGTGRDRRQAGACIEGRSAPSTVSFGRIRAAISSRDQ